MFGHNPLLRRKLEKNGLRAFATVLTATRTSWTETQGTAIDIEILYKLVLRVEPDGQPSFEADVDELFPYTWSPAAGGRLPVLYDGADHTRVLIDHSEQAQQELTDRTTTERANARIDRMRARGQNEIADRLQSIADAGLETGFSSNPDERRAQITDRQNKMREIMAGSHVLVDGQPVGGAAGSVATTAAALTQLAALRDRGVLSEAEWQAQKSKLLSA